MVAPVIRQLTAIARQQGTQVPAALPAATWVDARVLAAGVAESYAVPDTGVMLGINATTGPLYINFNDTAAAPAADINDGTASIMLRTDAGSPFLIAAPFNTSTLSMICAEACVVTIEVWK